MMQRFGAPESVRAWSRQARAAGERVGFVPTMGALHEGHLSLVDHARASCGRVAVSIFVNPTQFGPDEDLDTYPRDPEGDAALLDARGVDALFVPSTETIYPEGASTWVVETALSGRLEGIARPGHFRGVATVVTGLLHIVEPDLLVMGQKDAQQAAVIRRVLRDLAMGTQLLVAPIVREPDGLALSSRNAYLSPDERAQAVVLNQALEYAAARIEAGEEDPEEVRAVMHAMITERPAARVDYIAAVHPETFEPLSDLDGPVLLCLAVFIGETRLIDNLLVHRG